MCGRTNADFSQFDSDEEQDLRSERDLNSQKDDVLKYLRERRFSWPLLQGLKDEIPTQKF